MPNYQKMYTLLFNAITDALTCLEKGKEQTASRLLREAQQKTEELYILSKDAVVLAKKGCSGEKIGGKSAQ